MNTIAPSPFSLSIVRPLGLALALTISVGIGLTSCGKKEEPATASPTPAKEEPVPAPGAETPKASTPAPETKPAPAVAPEPKAEAKPTPAAPVATVSDDDLADRVKTFKVIYPFRSGGDLIRMPAFSSPLSSLLDAIGKDPALVERVKGSQPAGEAAAGKRIVLDLKMGNNSVAAANRLLTAVLSRSPERLVDLVLGNPSDYTFLITSK